MVLVLSGWLLLAANALAAGPIAEMGRSGFDFMGPSTQAMQRDDSLNPGMLWVKQGAALWQQGNGPGSRSCAACHGAATSSMRGVATRYPLFDAGLQRPVNLGHRINLCREQHQQLPPWRAESSELLSMSSYVAHQSRGLPLSPASDPRLAPFVERGQQRYLQRMGQLNLSCAQCHDQRVGLRLGGNLIPPADPAGYPLYRLEWQTLGSLQRRLRNCMNGVRAEPFPHGALELVELELFLAIRAKGMPLQTPAVRP